jgi:hypothetical protein
LTPGPVRRAALTYTRGLCHLANLAGWANYTPCSTLLHTRITRYSPLVISRFQTLAQLVGYTGPILSGFRVVNGFASK